MTRGRQRLLVPRVVQTSAMDCGPAALAALLRGLGISASYPQLRDRCATDVDGTSIATLEEVAAEHGLPLVQQLLPPEQVLLGRSPAAPLIAVVTAPGDVPHFVVLWRVHGPFVQVLDPASGRRWMRRATVRRWLWRHEAPVGQPAWAAWARGPGLLDPLSRRLRRLGLGRTDRESAIATATAAPGWDAVVGLEAAVRAAEVVGGARWPAVRRRRVLRRLRDAERSLPDAWRTARALGDEVAVRGALLLAAPARGDADGRQPSCARGRAAGPSRRRAARWAALPPGSRLSLAASALGASGLVAQALLLASVVRGSGGRGTLAAMAGLAAALAAVRFAVAEGEARAGRAVESGLRRAIGRRVPRLPATWFRTRPVSDLASRIHGLHELRIVPTTLSQAFRAGAELVAVGLAIGALSSLPWWAATAGALACAATALGGMALIRGADLRVEEQASAVTRFLLDCLLGALPLRAHVAQPAVARELGSRLRGWSAAARRMAWLSGIAALGEGVVAWSVGLLAIAAAAGTTMPAGLVVIACAFTLPLATERLGGAARALPRLAVLGTRLREPLRASARRSRPTAERSGRSGPLALAVEGLGVTVGERRLLSDVSLAIEAGEHVAIVGPTGSGKSTLLDVLLGFHDADAGRVLVDGESLTDEAVDDLRARTAWAGPAVTLWDAPVAANVAHGNPPGCDVVAAVATVGAGGAVRALAGRTVGFAGGRLSGGEGQRLRIARALGRRDPSLVVLDEALRGLDGPARSRLLRAVRQRWAGATVVCVTHDLESALTFPRAIVMRSGTIAEDGSPAMLARAGGSSLAAALEDERAAGAELGHWRRWHLTPAGVVEAPPDAAARRATGPLPAGAAPPASDPVAETLRLAGLRPRAGRVTRLRAELGGSDDDTPGPLRRTTVREALRRARVVRWTAAVAAVTGVRYALYLAAWIACVRHGAPALPTAALVAGLVVATALQTGLIARAALQVVGAVYDALASAVLSGGGGRARAEGIGGLLGRLQESRALESAATTGVLGGLLAVTELVVAGLILVSTGSLLLAGVLIAWLVPIAAGGLAAVRARAAWARARTADAGRLVEGMIGHRTVAFSGWPSSADGDGDALARRMDAWTSLLGAFAAGGWLTLAIAILALSSDVGGAQAAAVAGVVLATTGLARGAASIGVLASALVAWSRIRPLLTRPVDDRHPSDTDRPTAGPVLRARSIACGGAERPAVRGVDVVVERGDCIVLRGPSGVGKSTLCKVLAGLEPPSEGAVEIAGRAVLVPQPHENHLFLGQLAFNLLMGDRWPATPAAIDRADAVCRELGLGPLLDRMPAGIHEVVGETGWRLSDGERSLVCVARALLQRPDLLVLDESLAPLDHRARRRALRCVVRHAGAVVLVSHD